YSRYKEVADGLTQFIMSMSSSGLILRRRAEEKFDLISENPASASLKTGLMIHHGAIASGQFFTSYKFHDNLTADAVSHTGNVVRLTFDGAKYVTEVEKNVVSAAVLHEGDAVVFRTQSSVKAGSPDRVVGQVTYSYTFRKGAPGIDLQITFTAANGVKLDDIEVTSAVDQLRGGIDRRVKYSRVCASVDGKPDCKDQIPDEGTALFEGPLDLYSVIQEGTAGFSYAIHFRVLEPDKLEAVIAEGQKDGTLNHVYGIYSLGSVSNGESASVRETRVLTSGGLYENYGAYIDLLRSLDR